MSGSWLHISDLHFRAGDPYDREVVTDALLTSVARWVGDGQPVDAVFVTGDLAFSGQVGEYELASRFLDDLLDVVGLGREQLVVVPGNHDVDRDRGLGLARTLSTTEECDSYFRPGRRKPHLADKLAAYGAWFDAYFDGIRTFSADSTCGPIETIAVGDLTLALLPITSAAFCQDEEDHGRLLIGRRCLDAALEALAGAEVDLRLALLHHPLDWLNDVERSNVKRALHEAVDVVLRGHLHDTEAEAIASAASNVITLAAGATYQTRRWPNRAMFVDVDVDAGSLRVRPIRFEDSAQRWTIDPSIFPDDAADGFAHAFRLDREPTGPSPQPREDAATSARRTRTNIAARGDVPFVGRDSQLDEIAALMADTGRAQAVLLHGPPGVGKSELAREYARRHLDRYPGGAFLVDFTGGSGAVELARLGANHLGLVHADGLPIDDQCERTMSSMGDRATLLIYDNAGSDGVPKQLLPVAGAVCHVLVTSVSSRALEGWPDIVVSPLSRAESRDLVAAVAGAETADETLGRQLVSGSGGLPIQLLPASRAVAYELRRGRTVSSASGLQVATAGSFELVYDILDREDRLLLHAAAFMSVERIERTELSRHLVDALGWTTTALVRSLDACADLHLLDGTDQLTMHRLLAEFLAERALDPADARDVLAVRQAQLRRFVECAREVSAHPADAEGVGRLLTYPATVDTWIAAGIVPDAEESDVAGAGLVDAGRFAEALGWWERVVAEDERGDDDGRVDHEDLSRSLHQVGFCLFNVGRFEEAQGWFERAVAEAERGDVDERVDHDSVGVSLHLIGTCLSRLGEFEEARGWFERAVAEMERGDVDGRIDHEGLSGSLHQVGYCLSRLGEVEEAQGWFERAVSESERGDVDGRVDHDSLGASLHQVGTCLSRSGELDEARGWFERAVMEKERGDVHGRVDHGSLGASLHELGSCVGSLGVEARGWFERAVDEIARGDVHGRVDHESLGASLHQVGACFVREGAHDEARSWFERAVVEGMQGDDVGQIDHHSVGVSCHSVAVCHLNLGTLDEARRWFERAVAEKLKGDVHGRVDTASVDVSRKGIDMARRASAGAPPS